MGSDDKAVITGFICRLCSRMNRFVVHIYGDEGVQMQLAHKINFYLPITVNPTDPLPKTVCLQCIDSLEAQHELMEQFKWVRQRLAEANGGGLESVESRKNPIQPSDIQAGPSPPQHEPSLPTTNASHIHRSTRESIVESSLSNTSPSEIELDS